VQDKTKSFMRYHVIVKRFNWVGHWSSIPLHKDWVKWLKHQKTELRVKLFMRKKTKDR